LLVVHAIAILSASGKPSPLRSPLFSTTPSVPSYLTPPLSPCTGPGASPDLAAAPRPEGPAPSPSLSSSTVDRTESFASPSSTLHVVISCLGLCQEGALRAMDAPRGHLPTGRPVASRRWQRHAARQHRVLCALWTSTWSVHGICFRPRHPRQRPIARVDLRAQLGRRVATGEPLPAVPWHPL
jgi:hypothetical protein